LLCALALRGWIDFLVLLKKYGVFDNILKIEAKKSKIGNWSPGYGIKKQKAIIQSLGSFG